MDLKFYWYISSTWKDGVLRPRCSILNVDEALNIVNFLIDDEGLGIGHLQKWIKNGLEEINKISKNQQHDDEINKQLQFLGWTVIRFWGKDIIKKTDECVQVIEETIFEQKYNDYDIETEEISHV